ncbi:hypothetical protein D3C87_1744080 [compost metagenome]
MKLEALSDLLVLEDMAPPLAPDRKLYNPQEFEATLDEMTQRFEAARRALGLVNKLQDGPTKKKHASRVLSQMNTFRHYINVLMKQLHSMTQE